ncbi:ATP-binding response regulator [Variovorax sp. GB1P17]|uniref:ATP-binding response regulator n=1 Tax=Variovorax sp. GB1P17 TaxID=3443740 RepID=UPI003F458C9A
MNALPSTPSSIPVFAARMAALRRNLPFALLGVLLTVALVIAALYSVVPHAQLAAWAVANAALTAARGWCAWRYRFAEDEVGLHRWRRYTLAGTAAGGLLWGLPIACWMLKVPMAHQMFLVIALLTMGTGAIYAYCIDLPLLYGFQVPYFLPSMIVLALLPHPLLQVMGLAGMLYLFVTLAFAHRMHRTQVDSLQLRFENLDLLKRLQQEKEAAERSDLAKSRFLAAASHDLRQPVHALSLFVGVLREQALPALSRHLVDNISRATQAMGALFEGLLNLSRLDAGVVRARVQPFALDGLLEQIALEFAPQAASRSLVLRMRPSDTTVLSDPALLDRILRNLVDNAIRHTGRGGVLVGCRRVGDALRIEIWDTGPGIPPDEHERVFWEFHQLGNPERDRAKGLGLGLAIVRRTATLLGHPLAMRSRVGRGTVFRLTVPMAKVGTPVNEVTADTALQAPSQPESALIFVIEDDAPSRYGLQLLLQGWGHRVVAAAGAAEMLELIEAVPGKPSLIVSDYRLRDHQTGIQAIDRLHEEYNDDTIPALLVSGDTDPQRLIEVAARGWPLLHKPVDPTQLRTAIAQLLA